MDNINEFIAPIIMRKNKHDIKAWISYRKLIKKCKKMSPSFDEMCKISEFLDIIRYSYMYGNNDKFHLFIGTTPKGYNKSNSCSMFYKGEDFSIGFILLKDTRTISIEIYRKGQNVKLETERIHFIDGEYEFKDIYDEEKFLFMTSCLMTGVTELVTYYFKNKKF
jgi:hypothetical protein